MPRIEVDTSEVKAAASQVHQAGATAREGATSVAGGPISSPGFRTADAIAQFCSAWATGLSAYSNACESVSTRLSTAGTVYEVVETRLSEAF